jgi:hypothetical protein
MCFRSPASAVRSLSPKLLDRLNDDEKASWQFIAGRESVTSPELMEQMGFNERKAQRRPVPHRTSINVCESAAAA